MSGLTVVTHAVVGAATLTVGGTVSMVLNVQRNGVVWRLPTRSTAPFTVAV